MAIASSSESGSRRDVSYYVPPLPALEEAESSDGGQGSRRGLGSVGDDEARQAMLRLVATVVRRQGVEAVNADVMRFLLDELHSGELRGYQLSWASFCIMGRADFLPFQSSSH